MIDHPYVTTSPARIAICGKGRIATDALDYTLHALKAWGLEVSVCVCPNRDDPGYDTWYPSLRKRAWDLGVDVSTLDALSSEPGLVLLSLEFDRIIDVGRFASDALFNVHFSLLPAYRGVYTSIWPILNGEAGCGVTLHEIDRGIDTGDIVDQVAFPVHPELTARALYDRYMDYGFTLFRTNLRSLLEGTYEARPQPEEGASSYNRKSLDFARLDVDLKLPAQEVARFVRAYHFPEYQLPSLAGRAVWGCRLIDARSDRAPGTQLVDTGRSASYVAGDGKVVELVWA